LQDAKLEDLGNLVVFWVQNYEVIKEQAKIIGEQRSVIICVCKIFYVFCSKKKKDILKMNRPIV
jgi:hypothetical protein